MATPPNLFFRAMSAAHVFLYRATRGTFGGMTMGVPTLLLTTVGRKTGKARTAPLMYGRDGDNLVLIASKGGAPEHPLWYTNMKANPDVEVQVGGNVRKVRYRDATPEERPRLWRMMAEQYPSYDDYQKKTTREIPVVVLEPRA